MKRLLSVCLIFCLLVGISACGAEMNSVEDALIAVQAMDMDDFLACTTKDSETALSRMHQTFASDIAEHEMQTLRSLYGLIRYTMGEETTVSDGVMTVSVTVKLPDMARIRTLAEKKILVSAETADDVISEMLESGEIGKNYMIDAVWQVKMVKENEEWRIPYADKENDAFASGLYLSEMILFFAQH